MLSTILKPGKAVFMTDFLRCSLNELPAPTSNRKLLTHLFRPALQGLGWNCAESFSTYEGGSVDSKAIMQSLDISPGVVGWASSISSNITPAMENYFSEILSADLVLSYGITPSIARLLDRMSIPYIDVEVSPLRFGADLFWYARSNHQGIAAALDGASISDDYFYGEAAHLSAALAWRGLDKVLDAQKKYGVFVGQSKIDVALIAKGVIVKPEDFAADIVSYFSDVDEVIFAPHPYDNLPDASARIGAILNGKPVRDSDVKTYQLLCANNVSKISALSSSVLKEASYFMKPAQSLMTPDRDQIQFWKNTSQDISSRRFWKSILDDVVLVQAQPYAVRSLKNVFGMGWGQDDLY
jgi:hypothetical protein